MRKSLVPIVVLVVVAVAACGSSSGSAKSSTSGGGSGAAQSSTTASGGSSGGSSGSGSACSKYTNGKDGVIRTFCDGSGTVKVTVAGKDLSIGGVTCDSEGGYFTLNGGVVVGQDFSGPKPDYAGFLLPEKGGAFTNATLALDIGGKGYALTQNTGTLDASAKTGTFSATNLGDGAVVKGSFSC